MWNYVGLNIYHPVFAGRTPTNGRFVRCRTYSVVLFPYRIQYDGFISKEFFLVASKPAETFHYVSLREKREFDFEIFTINDFDGGAKSWGNTYFSL